MFRRVLTPFVSSQNQNDPKQQYLETLKKLNLDIIQENNKILFPTMNCNPLFSLPTLPFPIQANNPLQNLQNTNLLNNLRCKK